MSKGSKNLKSDGESLIVKIKNSELSKVSKPAEKPLKIDMSFKQALKKVAQAQSANLPKKK